MLAVAIQGKAHKKILIVGLGSLEIWVRLVNFNLGHCINGF